jgi:protein-disulfide isomerase
MNTRNIAIAAVGAIVIGAAGYFIGVGQGPSAANTEAAVKAYLAANPDLVKADEPATEVDEPVVVAGLSDAQRTEVEATIRSHLMANPEIIRDAIDELQRKQDESEQLAQIAAISDNKDLLFNSEHQVVIGNPDGDVTLVEFFDYNCGYCRRAHADMKQLIAEDENLRVVLKEFPVLGEDSVEAAQVSIAVKLVAPEKSGAFQDALLTHPGQANAEVALAVAEEIGIDPEALKAKLDSDDISNTITEVYSLASELSLTGTPSYVTSGEVVIGAVGFDSLKSKIETARAACAETATC